MTRMFSIIAAAIVLFYACTPAVAQSYPQRPIRMLVGLPAGGSTDIMSRLLQPGMQEFLKQNVIVESRGGAGGYIGSDAVAKSPADGSVLLLTINSHTINASLFAKLNYDPVKDFDPVSLVNINTLLLVANPRMPFRSVSELVSYARANPGKLNYGAGTSLGQVAGVFHATTLGRQDQLGTKGLHGLGTLDAQVLRHDQHHAVATDGSGHRQGDAGIARCRLDQGVAGLDDVRAGLGLHRCRHRFILTHS